MSYLTDLSNHSFRTYKPKIMFSKLKLSIVALVFLASTAVKAQKGSWYVGGQVGFNTRSEKNTGFADINSSTWSIAPEVGTFLQKNLQLGFALNLGGNHTDASGTNPSVTTTAWSPVIYLRKFYPVGDKFSLFTGIVGNFTVGSTSSDGNSGTVGGWGLNFTLGAAYAVSKTFTVVGQYGLFGYSYQSVKIDGDKSSVSNFGLNVNSLGPVFNVGLYWTFKE
jgi:hypothetical protein